MSSNTNKNTRRSLKSSAGADKVACCPVEVLSDLRTSSLLTALDDYLNDLQRCGSNRFAGDGVHTEDGYFYA